MQDFARRMTAPDAEPHSTKRRPAIETSIVRAVIGTVEDARAPMLSQHDIEDPEGYVVEQYRVGDFKGALDMAELLLAETPDNIRVQEVRDNCREVLARELVGKLGGLDRVPVALDDSAALECALIDDRAGLLFSLVDGESSLGAIVDASGVPEYDALRIVQEMAIRRVIGFG
jgi:hypothetical protein